MDGTYGTYGNGVALKGNGDIYVSDTLNHRIIKYTSDGTASVFVGSGTPGYIDGSGVNAQFNKPMGLVFDSDGYLYVADNSNNCIRKITPTGGVTTISIFSGLNSPTGLSIDLSGNIARSYMSGFGINETIIVADTGNLRLLGIVVKSDYILLYPSYNIVPFQRGYGNSVQFNYCVSVTVDSRGTVYIAETNNHRILKISLPAWNITTSVLAGSGTPGYNDGIGQTAQFNSPVGLSCDSLGNLYVTDTGNHCLRKIKPNGTVTTIAGNGSSGNTNGIGANASFNFPVNIAISKIYDYAVLDSGNNSIRNGSLIIRYCSIGTYSDANSPINECLYCPNGSNSIQGSTSISNCVCNVGTFMDPIKTFCLACPTGTTSSLGSTKLENCTAGTIIPVTSFSTTKNSQTNTIYGSLDVTDASNSNRYYVDSNYYPNSVYKSTWGYIPGNGWWWNPGYFSWTNPVIFVGNGTAGYADGTGTGAVFTSPSSIIISSNGNLYVSENSNTATQRIRQVTPSGVVISLTHGTGITMDIDRNIYVSDTLNHRIMKITLNGASTVFAGNGTAGYVNGTGTAAQFNYPNGLATDSSGNIYVADTGNNSIRKITPTGEVTTISTQFYYPNGIAIDPSGNMFVCDTFNNRIRRSDANGLNSSDTYTLNFPVYLAIDSQGNKYYSDTGNHVILKNNVVFAGNGTAGYTDGSGTNAQFNKPSGLSVDSTGNVYLADYGNNRIRKITPNGQVTTIAGSGIAGNTNGSLVSAQFNNPVNITVDPSGVYAYVIDSGNNSIRKLVLPCLTNCSCDAGSYIGASGCLYCPQGTYSSESNVTSCNSCPVGTYSGTVGATSLSVCNACPVGTYSGITGAASIVQCSPCPLGTYSDTTGNAQCTPCPAGRQYSDILGSTSCKTCSPGYFTPYAGLSACLACPAGRYDNGSICTPCSAGTYSVAGSTSCTTCPVGTYSYDEAPNACTPCDLGTYSSTTGTANSCTACPAGSYSSTVGSSSCTTCPAGSYSSIIGATSKTVCTPCELGTYSPAGSSTCLSSCPEGIITIGSACISLCLPGNYKSSLPCGSSSQCGTGGQCLSGFCSNITCNTCPAGTFYVGPGANSVNDCIPCGPGTYSGLGFPICTSCPPGTSFSGTRGTSDTVCVSCTAGTYSNSAGSTSCSSCPVGTSSSIGSSFCYRATGGIIEDRGLYITHTFTSSSNFVPLSAGGITIIDFISTTPNQIYSSPDVFRVTQTTPITISAASTPTMAGKVPYLNTGTSLTTDYGTFTVNTSQITVVYLKKDCKIPCTLSSQCASGGQCLSGFCSNSWNPLKKQCVPACTTPFTTSQDGVCVKCTSRTLALIAPLVCEPGFTLSGTTCTGNEYTCPDPSWTLSGTTCTKTDVSCPVNSVITGKGYCLSTDFSSSVPVSSTLTQTAVVTQVTKPASGSVCSAMCPINTYMRNGVCVQCPGNQLSAAGSTSDSACECPAGTFGTNGSGLCTSCGTDQTSSRGTQTQSGCVIYCPANKYASGSSCMPCPYGTSPAGSTSVSACACSLGTFLSGSSCVTQCPAGMYSSTVTASCTPCPGNQTSAVGTTSVIGCACPDETGGINGTGVCSSCTGGQTSTVTNLQCPDTTWNLTGSVCSKVSSYGCPNSTDYLTVNTCYYTTFTYPKTGCTLKNYTCPRMPRGRVNGSVCLKTGQPMTTATVTVSCPNAASYTCPNGYTLSGSTCTSNTPSYYSCPSGGSGTITTSAGVTTVKSTWVLEGTRCRRYTCSASTPSGSYLTINGSSCKFYNSTYSCPSGYSTGANLGSLEAIIAGLQACSRWDLEATPVTLYITRSSPYTTNPSTSVSDDVPATPVNDTIPASHPMVDHVVTGTLTRSEAQVISIETTNATTGLSQRQCMCLSGQFWDFATKKCTTQCPAATYADSASKTCQPCPANKTSVAGSTSVSQCVCSYASPYWSGTSCMQQLNPTAAVTVSGSGITTRYVNKYVIHEFTQAASFVVQNPIIANILLVGGGAGGANDGKSGNGGGVTTLSNQSLNTGTYNITIGAGGGPNTIGGCTFFSK